MKKIFIILIFSMLLLSVGLVSAHEHDFAGTRQLMDSGISCDKLADEELESIGDYYMGQMHPGNAHKMMDQMMGGEGSESLKQMHIAIARRMYCNENADGMMGGGMMDMMMGNNMMGSGGMMGMMGTNMMGGSFGRGSWWLWSIVGMLFWIALLVALILLIIWLYKKITGQTTNNGSALEILKKRFAKGEITKRQYREMKRELMSDLNEN